MSPLVIARNQASCQNLVESTKVAINRGFKNQLERIVIDSKTARRKEKKEKKERRKHKKEKHEKSRKHSSKKADDAHKKPLLPTKKTSDESEQLEKSGLTEELEGPQNHLGYQSDGSQNSKKRKRDDFPPAVESVIKAAPVAGNPLRIRLIFKKPKAEVSVPPREELVCSTSVAKSVRPQDVITSSVSCSKIYEPEENLPSTSAVALAETKKRKKHKPSKEDRYNALFDDWTPPSSLCFPAMEVDSSSKDDDDDWLFGNRTQEQLSHKAAVKIDENMNMSLHRCGDSTWPRAQFLSEVGIYSLPYTVPF